MQFNTRKIEEIKQKAESKENVWTWFDSQCSKYWNIPPLENPFLITKLCASYCTSFDDWHNAVIQVSIKCGTLVMIIPENYIHAMHQSLARQNAMKGCDKFS